MKLRRILSLLAVAAMLPAGGVACAADAAVSPLKGAIKLDGHLDEPSWRSATENPPLVELKTGSPVPENLRTTFKVLNAGDGLYIGIVANEPNIKELKKNAPAKLDSAIWLDDDVEVFLDTHGDRMEYYQFAVNPSGAKCDLYMIEGGNTGQAGYNPTWQAATFIGDNYYSVELFIPFSGLFKRRLKDGRQDWNISITRQRMAGREARHTAFNPSAKGFHDPASWGKLTGVTIPVNRYVIAGEIFRGTVEKGKSGYLLVPGMTLANAGETVKNVIVKAEIDGKSSECPLALAAGKTIDVELPAIGISDALGLQQATFSILDQDDRKPLLANIAELLLEYRPITVNVISPAFRNTIYFTETVSSIEAEVSLKLPSEKLKGAELEVAFADTTKTIHHSKIQLNGKTAGIPVKIPVSDLPCGNYSLNLTVISPDGTQLAATAEIIRKLPNAPGIEVRINREGITLINGVPIMIRGWYGNAVYRVPPSSFASARMPRTINFMMGGDEVSATRQNYYCLVGLERIDGLESTAKAGAPLSEAIKKKKTRHRPCTEIFAPRARLLSVGRTGMPRLVIGHPQGTLRTGKGGRPLPYLHDRQPLARGICRSMRCHLSASLQ